MYVSHSLSDKHSSYYILAGVKRSPPQRTAAARFEVRARLAAICALQAITGRQAALEVKPRRNKATKHTHTIKAASLTDFVRVHVYVAVASKLGVRTLSLFLFRFLFSCALVLPLCLCLSSHSCNINVVPTFSCPLIFNLRFLCTSCNEYCMLRK